MITIHIPNEFFWFVGGCVLTSLAWVAFISFSIRYSKKKKAVDIVKTVDIVKNEKHKR